MNTAKKIYQSDDKGVVHVEVPMGRPDHCVEVVVVWQEVPGEGSADEGWADLFGR